jgi:GDP-4-dehydro-6-deoxy-D-mannose reductase
VEIMPSCTPFNHTGSSQSIDFIVPAFAAQIARIERGDLPPVISTDNLSNQGDFLDIPDVVDAYCRTIARFDDLPPSCVMNLASGHGISIANILDMLVSISSTKFEIVQDAARMRWEPQVDFLSALATVLDYYRGLDRNLDDVVNRQ